MALIGDWDDTNIKLALAFNAWSKGNGTVDQNVGEMPGYPDGSFNAIFTNMGAGFGFVNNSNDGYCLFDATNDHLTTNFTPTFTNANKFTFEYKVRVTGVGSSQILYSQKDDANNNITCLLAGSGALFLTFVIGGVSYFAQTNETLSDNTQYTLHFIKDGATIKVYINGNQATYAAGADYTAGDVTLTNPFWLGARDDTGPAFIWNDKIYWAAIYDDAISGTRITTNAGLGNAMGLIGTNTADVMTFISDPVATPTITPNGRSFEISLEITLEVETAGASIYYTLDGNDPTIADTLYSAPFTITDHTHVKAIGIKSGQPSSSIASEIYREGAVTSAPDPLVLLEINSTNPGRLAIGAITQA